MPRIAGVDIPDNKPIGISLTYIQGIGNTLSREILKKAEIDLAQRARELSGEQISRIASFLDKEYVIEGQLRRSVAQDILRLRKIGCYRGIRHGLGLPVRGQRTRTNARTRKGKKKTVAGKRGVKEKR